MRNLSTTTRALIADDREFLWHPFTPMKPWCEDKEIIVVASAQNEFLIDTEGNRYIDGVSSLWCNIHGHNIAELNDAVTGQLRKVAHSTLLGLANVPSIELARRLVQLVQSCGLNLSKVFLSDNGSTAVEVAAKMAYQYWRNLATSGSAGDGGARNRFIALKSAYHGDTLGAVSLGGIPLFHHAFKSLTFPVDFISPPVAGSQQGPEACLAALENLLAQNSGVYAGVIVEPLVLGAGGMIMYPPSYLAAFRELADRHDTLLIFDEVLTGFGRTGKMFAAEHAPAGPVTPDLLCLSKGLTAGYLPLGATLATQKIFDAFYVDPNTDEGVTMTFFHGHTFTGNPLGCAAALASLDLFEKKNLLAHVQQLMPMLAEMLAAARQNPYVADARQCGLIGAIDLASPGRMPFAYQDRIAAALCTRLRSRGILLRPLADTLVIMPPLAITKENFQYLCHAVIESLAWVPEILAAKRITPRP